MKKYLIAVAAVVAVVTLAGCVTKPLAPNIEYVVVKPEKSDMVDVVITPPPIPEEYAAIKDSEVREAVLVSWGAALMKSLIDVNVRLKAIRDTVVLGETVYEGKQSK